MIEDRQCSVLHDKTWIAKVSVSVWWNAWLVHKHAYNGFQVQPEYLVKFWSAMQNLSAARWLKFGDIGRKDWRPVHAYFRPWRTLYWSGGARAHREGYECHLWHACHSRWNFLARKASLERTNAWSVLQSAECMLRRWLTSFSCLLLTITWWSWCHRLERGCIHVTLELMEPAKYVSARQRWKAEHSSSRRWPFSFRFPTPCAPSVPDKEV